MKISSLLKVHPRFMRSVHLERDIKDPTSSLGYILTPVAQQAFERIISGFRANSTQRAWRLAGDYGSGKTDFGLALARIAQGRKAELPKDLRQFIGPETFLPVLATGDNEPLGVTVLRALGVDPPSRGRRPATDEVLQAIQQGIQKAKRQKHAGLLLVLDEVGKNLEHAARSPDTEDIFLLQRMAEEAMRSGEKAFILVGLLHQGVAAYASALDSTAKREWDKVAGRFEEIVYAQPIEQVAMLLGATFNTAVDRIPKEQYDDSERGMAKALKLGLYGTTAPSSLVSMGPKLYPLHPTTLPVLVKTIRRFGQNERSLFSFVSSAEPMGLQQFAVQPIEQAGHYRIHHLFDHVRSNFLSAITTGSAHTHWGVVEAVMASANLDSPEAEAVLKTVAMLSLLDAADLPATVEIVALAVGGDRGKVNRAIELLRSSGVIYERGAVRGLCLWPHTSVDLDGLFTKAIQATSAQSNGVKLLCEQVRSAHLVPREYYARMGTLRYADVKLIPADQLPELLKSPPSLDGKGADLHVRVVLPADHVQQRKIKATLGVERENIPDGLYIAVAEPPTAAVVALQDLIAWQWVKRNTPQLSGDRYAREEVARQLAHAERNLRIRLEGLTNLAVPSEQALTWFHRGGPVAASIASGRSLLAFLGQECKRIYSQAPRILNELINRRSPSSAAVAARTKLVEAMCVASDQPRLGMDDTKRPAEMALYISILQAGGLHVETPSGWVFRPPTPKRDERNLLPSLELITRILNSKGVDALVSVPELFDELSRPPYGVRDGLKPFILAIYLATHHQRVALYEDGTYLHEVGGSAFLRMAKEPQVFQLQYCELKGVRADVFTKLLQLLQINPRDASRTDVIDLVRPLAVFISKEVPEYCRRTNNLSANAVAVRKALLDERQPVRLVFTSLPEACGLPPVGKDGIKAPNELAARLRMALHEIRTAYPTLIERLNKAILAAFDVSAGVRNAREKIGERAAQLAVVVTEPSLKAFALRLADRSLEQRAWVESIANLLSRKSAERWTDNDETEFNHQLEIAAGRFVRTEYAFIGTTKKLNGHACRIALTKSDGTEVGDLINWDGMDEEQILPVEGEIEQILSKHGRHGLAAAMRAIWSQLDREHKSKKS